MFLKVFFNWNDCKIFIILFLSISDWAVATSVSANALCKGEIGKMVLSSQHCCYKMIWGFCLERGMKQAEKKKGWIKLDFFFAELKNPTPSKKKNTQTTHKETKNQTTFLLFSSQIKHFSAAHVTVFVATVLISHLQWTLSKYKPTLP